MSWNFKDCFRPLSLVEKHVTDVDRGTLNDTFFPPLDSMPNKKKKIKSVFCDYVSFFTATQSSEHLLG